LTQIQEALTKELKLVADKYGVDINKVEDVSFLSGGRPSLVLLQNGSDDDDVDEGGGIGLGPVGGLADRLDQLADERAERREEKREQKRRAAKRSKALAIAPPAVPPPAVPPPAVPPPAVPPPAAPAPAPAPVPVPQADQVANLLASCSISEGGAATIARLGGRLDPNRLKEADNRVASWMDKFKTTKPSSSAPANPRPAPSVSIIDAADDVDEASD